MSDLPEYEAYLNRWKKRKWKLRVAVGELQVFIFGHPGFFKCTSKFCFYEPCRLRKAGQQK